MDITFDQGLLTLTIRENAVIDQKDVYEFLGHAREMTGGAEFVVLTDARAEHLMVKAAQDTLRAMDNPRRLANAIVTADNFTENRVTGFIGKLENGGSTRQFTEMEAARAWLKEVLARNRK